MPIWSDPANTLLLLIDSLQFHVPDLFDIGNTFADEGREDGSIVVIDNLARRHLEQTGFLDRITKEISGAIDKACRGCKAPLRAFCRQVGSDFTPASLNPRSSLLGYRRDQQTSVGVSLIAMPLRVC